MFRVIFFAMASALALVVAVALGADALDRPFGYFSREPSEVLGAPWYTGFLFHVGLLVWFTSAVACLFAGALIARVRGAAEALPLLAGGLLCLFLSVDDGFRLHDDVAPGFLGVPKTATYAVHALAFGSWLFVFRRYVRRSNWPLLMFGCTLLAGSVGFDRVFAANQQHIFEDGLKFLGIVAWTLYFASEAFRGAIAAARSPARVARAEDVAAKAGDPSTFRVGSIVARSDEQKSSSAH